MDSDRGADRGETWRRRALGGGAALAAVIAVVAIAVGPRDEPPAARGFPTYTPSDPSQVVAEVPPRDPREVELRAQLRAAPDRVDVAVALAKLDIQRSRSRSDPRYLGRAQATLARWWAITDAPPDVILMRATIEQSLHDFTAARADLDRLVALRPSDPQALLTRAVVATVTGDYPAARASCDQLAPLADALIVETCRAQVDAVTGHARTAQAELAHALDAGARIDPSLREWALTALADLSSELGDYAAAEAQLRAALAIDPNDAYALSALADVLMWTRRPQEASQLLAGREVIDNLLVRRAIAEHLYAGPQEATWVRAMHERIAAAAERNDTLHQREQARFTLEVEADPHAALQLALANWSVQKELADARLVAQAAAAAGDASAAEPVRAWAAANHVEDVQLAKALGQSP